jgi:hypothetical protein
MLNDLPDWLAELAIKLDRTIDSEINIDRDKNTDEVLSLIPDPDCIYSTEVDDFTDKLGDIAADVICMIDVELNNDRGKVIEVLLSIFIPEPPKVYDLADIRWLLELDCNTDSSDNFGDKIRDSENDLEW